MRDIIFRGKRLYNGEWEYGDLLQYDDGSVCIGVHSKNYTDDGFNSGQYRRIALVDEDTVGQYTGMKDKNGKKIFEGDIMSLVTEFGDTIIREIRFIDGAFCVIGEQEDDLHGLSWAVEMCDGIVGDNIHDNPDLLK